MKKYVDTEHGELSIQDMLELLGDNLLIITNNSRATLDGIENPYWAILLWFDEKNNGKELFGNTLADALYKAVDFMYDNKDIKGDG